MASFHILNTEVPQGSVCAPVMFSLLSYEFFTIVNVNNKTNTMSESTHCFDFAEKKIYRILGNGFKYGKNLLNVAENNSYLQLKQYQIL